MKSFSIHRGFIAIASMLIMTVVMAGPAFAIQHLDKVENYSKAKAADLFVNNSQVFEVIPMKVGYYEFAFALSIGSVARPRPVANSPPDERS